MLRNVRWIGVGVVLACGASTAAAQQLDELGSVGSSPRVQLELGASPTRSGFKLILEGGAPHGMAWLCLQPEGRPVTRRPVALDAFGGTSIVVRNHGLERACDAWFVGAASQLSGPSAPSFMTTRARLPRSTPIGELQLQRGDVVITEIMKDPSFVSDAAGEWFEVCNRTNHALDLEGWTLSDAGTNHHVIQRQGQGLWVAAGAYLVLGINANPAQNGGIAVDYKYSGFTLTNGADAIVLTDRDGLTIDAVAYDDGIFWPDTPGRSLSLDAAAVDAQANDEGARWCDADTLIPGGSTDLGTPGGANSSCP